MQYSGLWVMTWMQNKLGTYKYQATDLISLSITQMIINAKCSTRRPVCEEYKLRKWRCWTPQSRVYQSYNWIKKIKAQHLKISLQEKKSPTPKWTTTLSKRRLNFTHLDVRAESRIVCNAQAQAVRNGWSLLFEISQYVCVKISSCGVGSASWNQCVHRSQTNVSNVWEGVQESICYWKASEYYSKCKHSLFLAGNPVYLDWTCLQMSNFCTLKALVCVCVYICEDLYQKHASILVSPTI